MHWVSDPKFRSRPGFRPALINLELRNGLKKKKKKSLQKLLFRLAMKVVRSAVRGANYFLRKHRKWPFSPFKTKWHQTFNEHQALQILKQTAKSSNANLSSVKNSDEPYLLSALTNSFSSYNVPPTPSAYLFVLKFFLRTSQFSHVALVLDRLERIEKFETPEYIFNEIFRVYRETDKIHDAVDLFFRIPKFRCVPSVCLFNSLLLLLCRSSGALKMVPQVLLKSQSMGIRLEESSYRILVSALCRIGKVGYAIEIVNDVVNNGYGLEMNIFSLILSALSKQKGASCVDVKELLQELKRKRFLAGVADYSNVIQLLSKEGRGLDASDVLNQMKSDGFKPDIVCYTMVLRGVIMEGEYGKADKLFDELLLFGLVPDVYTYNVVIHGLCKQNKVEEAIQMVCCMEELGCQPNVITYNTLLEAICKTTDIDGAKNLMKKMKCKGVEANLRTYRLVLDCLIKKAEFIEACRFLEEMLEKCCSPSFSVLDEVISGLCQTGLVSKALELLEKMICKNVCPGAKSWEALLLCHKSKLVVKESSLACLVDIMSIK